MKKTLTTALLVLAIALTGCASSGVKTELQDTIVEACAFCQKAKPIVTEYRAWAVANWDLTITTPAGDVIPVIAEDQKAILLELDSYGPKIDTACQQICMVAEATEIRSAVSDGVDWDRVLSITLKVATAAAQLKAEGVI